MNRFLVMAMLSAMMFFSMQGRAAEVAYYGFEPEIVTNYVSTSGNKKLGYVRVSVELMLGDVSYVPAIEHHEPLLRDLIIEVFNRETEEKVKSLTGRTEINKKVFDVINEHLKKETGSELVKKVIFTKFLYE